MFFYVAMVYLGLGKNELALNWLEKAHSDRSNGLVFSRLNANSIPAQTQFPGLAAREQCQVPIVRIGGQVSPWAKTGTFDRGYCSGPRDLCLKWRTPLLYSATMCPFPRSLYLYVVSPSMPIGPRACSLLLLIPTSAPRP